MSNLLCHIGYHKTGTTWFQKHLFNNSTVGFACPSDKYQISRLLIIPHALDFEPSTSRKHLQPAIQEVQNRGLTPVLSHERFSGNPHSGGYDSKELADRLAAVFPEAKVLIVIREQKNIILSTYKQYVKIGGIYSLKNYLQPPTRGRTRIPLFDWDHFKYHRLIRYYLDLFGHSQVLVLLYELFREHPVEFVSQIVRFCGLGIDVESIKSLPYSVPKNESLSGISIALKRHLNRIVGPRDRLNPQILIPVAFMDSWKFQRYWQKLDSVIPPLFKKASENRLKTIAAELIGDRYKQSNSLTTKMINLNLVQYGYDL